MIINFSVTSINTTQVGSTVKLLKHWGCDQHGLGSKPTCAILLCPWEKHFMALSPAWWSWQAVLNFSHISIKFQEDSNILASLKQVFAYPNVLEPLLLFCKSEG